MDFLDALDQMRADEATPQRLFNREDGRGVRSIAHSPDYNRRLAEAATFVGEVMRGRRPAYQLAEALSTSDFPLLFGDIIDRQLLANYAETPQTYRQYARIGTVSDFRKVRRYAINGAEAQLGLVPELDGYPEAQLSDQEFEYRVNKYGRAIGFSWESIVNDDLDALRNIPERFGRAARRTEERFATALFAGRFGSGEFYSQANGNVVETATGAAADNPPLDALGNALIDAYTVLAKQRDVDGEPIALTEVVLVVPPALAVRANDLMNATTIYRGAADGSRLEVANWMRSMFKVVVNYYLPIVDPVHGNTAWYLFADPNQGRPALEVGFLRGHEAPETFMKDPDTVRIGGGGSDALNGDFDTDAIRYKVRHVIGGTLIDPKVTVASTGAGAVTGTARRAARVPEVHSAAQQAETGGKSGEGAVIDASAQGTGPLTEEEKAAEHAATAGPRSARSSKSSKGSTKSS